MCERVDVGRSMGKFREGVREGSQLIIIEAASTKGSLPLVDGRLIKQLSLHVQSLFPHLRDGPFHCDGPRQPFGFC